jgi:hypothetical protein
MSPRITVRRILAAVAEAAEAEQWLIASRLRSAELVEMRAAVVLIAREAQFSLPQIGRVLGRDHTTVLHALQAIDRGRWSSDRIARIGALAERARAILRRPPPVVRRREAARPVPAPVPAAPASVPAAWSGPRPLDPGIGRKWETPQGYVGRDGAIVLRP